MDTVTEGRMVGSKSEKVHDILEQVSIWHYSSKIMLDKEFNWQRDEVLGSPSPPGEGTSMQARKPLRNEWMILFFSSGVGSIKENNSSERIEYMVEITSRKKWKLVAGNPSPRDMG